MVQSILLVISVIIITMSFIYDKSVKELIENPPPAIVELFQDTADTAAEQANAIASEIDGIEASIKEANGTADEIIEKLDTKSRMEQATE